MPYDDHIPTLDDALKETGDQSADGGRPPRKEPDYIPPPPKDWTSHISVKVILWLMAISLVVFGFLKGPGFIERAKENPSTVVFPTVIIVVIVLIIGVAYWKTQTEGERRDRYWKQD